YRRVFKPNFFCKIPSTQRKGNSFLSIGKVVLPLPIRFSAGGFSLLMVATMAATKSVVLVLFCCDAFARASMCCFTGWYTELLGRVLLKEPEALLPNSEAMAPGMIVITLIPKGANSMRMASERLCRADFVAQ